MADTISPQTNSPNTISPSTISPSTISPSTISIEEFRRLDLRVATVTAADVHPKADRLLVLRLAMAGEERQVVAGIRGHYEPAALVGRQVIVVANLAPAVLRGVESQGMVLAAADADRVVLLAPERPVTEGVPVR